MDAEKDDEEGIAAITRFMRTIEEVARLIDAGDGSWENVHEWAAHNTDRMLSTRSALATWEIELGHLFYSADRTEQEAEAALDRRSQHAFAREAFRGTEAEGLLVSFEDAEVDEDVVASTSLEKHLD
jgi:hypothetical protein